MEMDFDISTCFGVIGAELGEDSENNKNLDDNTETLSDSPDEQGGESPEKTDSPSEKEDVSNQTADYKNVFVLNLLEEWEKYSGENVSVSFKTAYVYDYGDRMNIDSEYYNEINEKLSVETKESEKISEGDWITVCGIVGKEVAVYDDREVKEPKLAKGDTITIYGRGQRTHNRKDKTKIWHIFENRG